MAALVTIAKAEMISEASQIVFGFRPSIRYTSSQAIIRFSPEQNKTIAAYFERMAAAPGQDDIDLDLKPLLTPWAIRILIPLIVSSAGLGGVIGYMIKR